MATVFELSASLGLEADAFYAGLSRAESAARALEGSLTASAAAASSAVRALAGRSEAALTGLTSAGNSAARGLEAALAGAWSRIAAQIRAATAQARAFFAVRGTQSAAPGGAQAGGYAAGLGYVPYDNFPASLHRGEAVLSRPEAQNWRAGAEHSGSGAPDIAQLLCDALRGVSVQLNGEAVGALIAPAVSEIIGRQSALRRYTG